MNRQTTFDIIVRGMSEQVDRSLRDEQGTACALRGADGKKCAAGFLIPDERFDSAWDNGGTLRNRGSGLMGLIHLLEELGHDVDLVVRCQDIHDAVEPSHWRERLAGMAKEYDLTLWPTKQQTFDIVAVALLKQNAKAQNKATGNCLYRDGRLKCAAGHLIPDARYLPTMEGQLVKAGDTINPTGQVIKDIGHDLDLVADLQSTHDFNSPESWHCSLTDIAVRHKLNTEAMNDRRRRRNDAQCNETSAESGGAAASI